MTNVKHYCYNNYYLLLLRLFLLCNYKKYWYSVWGGPVLTVCSISTFIFYIFHSFFLPYSNNFFPSPWLPKRGKDFFGGSTAARSHIHSPTWCVFSWNERLKFVHFMHQVGWLIWFRNEVQPGGRKTFSDIRLLLCILQNILFSFESLL